MVLGYGDGFIFLLPTYFILCLFSVLCLSDGVYWFGLDRSYWLGMDEGGYLNVCPTAPPRGWVDSSGRRRTRVSRRHTSPILTLLEHGNSVGIIVTWIRWRTIGAHSKYIQTDRLPFGSP